MNYFFFAKKLGRTLASAGQVTYFHPKPEELASAAFEFARDAVEGLLGLQHGFDRRGASTTSASLK